MTQPAITAEQALLEAIRSGEAWMQDAAPSPEYAGDWNPDYVAARMFTERMRAGLEDLRNNQPHDTIP